MPVFTPSPTKTFTATPIVLDPPQHVEASIEYVKEYYGISCGFNVGVFYQSELPVKIEISWKNLSKGGSYSGGSYTPVDGKVMYYSAPSGFSSNKNAKPVPFIADGNVIQVSVRAFLEFQNQIIYSEPSLIEIQCAK